MISTTRTQVGNAIEELGLVGKSVCLHCSFRSFKRLDGGPDALLEEFLVRGCTVMALCLSYAFASPPPLNRRPSRNGMDYETQNLHERPTGPVYDPASNEVNEEMVGVVSKNLLLRQNRWRGNHPRSSFVAVGPRAKDLIESQAALDVFAPLRRLVELDGSIVLIGVGLDKMTLLHLAEQRAGREPFRRWANGPNGEPIELQEGGCSSGFPKLEPFLGAIAERRLVGQSQWTCFSAHKALDLAVATIRDHPDLTRCSDVTCLECRDAVAGGPINL